MFIDSSGNMGLGTQSPSSLLHLYDGGVASDQTITFGNPATTPEGSIKYSASGSEFLDLKCKGTTTGFGNIRFFTGPGPSEAMTIDSSGRMGLGSQSPNASLHIRTTSAGADPTHLLLQNSSSDSGTAASIYFVPNVVGTSRAAKITGINEDGGNSTALTLWTNPEGSNSVERMRIDGSGNMGLGTQSPSANLDISPSSGAAEVRIAGASSQEASIRLFANQGATAADIKRFLTDTSGNLKIQHYSGSSYVDSLVIDSSGNIDVTQALTVSSDIVAESNVRSDGFFQSRRTSGGNTCFTGQLNGSATSTILADGSATFSGRVNVGTSTLYDRGIHAYNSSTSAASLTASNYASSGPVWQGYNVSVNSTNASSTIFADGSATFTGAVSVDAGSTNENSSYGPGYLIQNRSVGTSNVWTGQLNGSTTSSILANGNATFTGIVTATSFSGDGSNLTNTGATLSASSGTQRLVMTSLSSGTMTSAATRDALNYNTSTSILSVPSIVASSTVTASSFSGGGASLTSLNASNISSGTISDDRLPATISSDITGNAATASNASQLDGIDSSQFLRSDTNDSASGEITFNGVVNIRSDIDLADNDTLRFGSGDDVEFFCDGSHMYTDLNSGIGNWYIRDGSTTRFTFDDAGHFTATGDLIANSDIKLKTNIQPLENSLEKVNQLRGVSYDRVDIEKDNCIGVIAQEVEEVYPEFVSEGEDGTKGVDYSKMVAVLIESVKELTAEVNTLRNRVNELESN